MAVNPPTGAHSERPAGDAGGQAVPPGVEELASHFPDLEIMEEIGRGGMGVVYMARQPRLDRLVALKIMAPAGGGDDAFAERFAREARALARLDHPGIVAVHDFGRAGGVYYLIMQFVDGPNLRAVLNAGRLPPAEALRIVPQLCAALQYAHDEGIVHRDVKPENILLDRKGRVKIADFGLAKLLVGGRGTGLLTSAGQAMGTPHYMAPEQLERPHEVDHRADIYSLGVVFYEMLTGELPLGRFAAPSKAADVDDRLDPVVLRALEKEPGRRYQRAGEVKTEVESISAARPETGRPAPVERDGPPAATAVWESRTPSPRGRREARESVKPARRFPVRSALVAAVLALLATTVGFGALGLGGFLPDAGVLGLGFGLCLLLTLAAYATLLMRTLAGQRDPAPGGQQRLRALSGLLICVNAGVALASAAFTKPGAGYGFCWRTGNEAEHAVKTVLYGDVFPFLVAYPWPVVVASAIISAGLYTFAARCYTAHGGSAAPQ
jgi:hypothetical protein